MFQFTAEQRAIFSYHDGEAQRFGDPLELERRIRFELGDVAALVDKANTRLDGANDLTVKQALQAAEKLSLAIRRAFELKDFDTKTGKGATEAMALGVWAAFCAFLAQKKTLVESSPTSSPGIPPFSPSSITPPSAAST